MKKFSLMLLMLMTITITACSNSKPASPTGDIEKDCKALVDAAKDVTAAMNNFTAGSEAINKYYADKNQTMEFMQATNECKAQRDTTKELTGELTPLPAATGDMKKDAQVLDDATALFNQKYANFSKMLEQYSDYYTQKGEAEAQKFSEAVEKAMADAGVEM